MDELPLMVQQKKFGAREPSAHPPTRDSSPSTAVRVYGACGAQGVMVETDGTVLWCIFKAPGATRDRKPFVGNIMWCAVPGRW